MRTPRTRRWLERVVTLALTALALLASSCSEKPAEPTFDNVLDPEVSSDLVRPDATFANRAVAIVWNHLLASDLGEEVKTYTVSRSVRSDRGFSVVSTVNESVVENGRDDDIPGNRTTADVSYVPDTVNYYAVAFELESGRRTLAPGAPMTSILTPPRVALQSGTGQSATRHPKLVARSASSLVAHVSSDPAFSDFMTVSLEAGSTEPVVNSKVLDWDLGAANANGDTLWVYMRTPRSEGGYSAVDALPVEVSLHPGLSVVENPVYQPDVQLRVPIAGVVRMRFATTAAGLPTAQWMEPDPPDTTVNILPFQLSTSQPNPQVWAEYEGDFGFFVVESTTIVPAEVGPATLTIDGGAEFTTDPDRTVTVVSNVANATLMRFSESPDFTGVAWTAYEDTVRVQLSAAPGVKTLYGWFTNVYDTVGQAASDDILLVGETPR